MTTPASLSRRRLLGVMLGASLPAARARGRSTPRFVVQTEPSLAHCTALLYAAVRAAGFAADFIAAPATSERRNLYETEAGRIHINLLPPSATRFDLIKAGRLRMIPIPLERGLLGWRVIFVLQSRRNLLADVRTLDDLRAFTVGQGTSWWDTDVFRAAGVTTRELQAWRHGEFAEQMQAGIIDLFPMGLEESFTHFLPLFQARYPTLVLDQHILLHYPWYRLVWVSAHPSADDLYFALNDGFDQIARNGEFEAIWKQYRQKPSAKAWRGRTLISLDNPLYDESLIPQRYRHLLLQLA